MAVPFFFSNKISLLKKEAVQHFSNRMAVRSRTVHAHLRTKYINNDFLETM